MTAPTAKTSPGRLALAIHDLTAVQQAGQLFIELHLEVDEKLSLREVEHENEVLREFFKFAKKRPGLELRGAQIIGLAIGEREDELHGLLIAQQTKVAAGQSYADEDIRKIAGQNALDFLRRTIG